MKYILSCSGGKDSVASLILAAVNKLPLDEVVLSEVMFDKETSGEMPEQVDFVYNRLKPFVEKEIGVPFTIVRSAKTYVDCFEHIISRGENKGLIAGFPIPGMCCINRDCKIPPIKAYWKTFGEDVTQYVGICADEPLRLARLRGTNKTSVLEKYGVGKHESPKICAKYNLLSPVYNISKRNGCWFCMNCQDREWSHLIYNHPKLFNKLIELENKHPIRYRKAITRTETPSQIKKRILAQGKQLSIFD